MTATDSSAATAGPIIIDSGQTEPSEWQKKIEGEWVSNPSLFDAEGVWQAYENVSRASEFRDGQTRYWMRTQLEGAGRLRNRFELGANFDFGVIDSDENRVYTGPDFYGTGQPYGLFVDSHYYSPGWQVDLRTWNYVLPDLSTQVYSSVLHDGWTVVVSGRRKAELDRVVAGITGAGGKAEAIALDVSSKDDVNRAAEAIIAKHGRIDLLVNSAGVNVPRRSWEDFDLDGWNKVVDINLNGVLYCMRAVLPAMRRQKDGCIINVASWAGRHVSKMTGPAYTTTKHAVLALTHSFNMDECVNGLRACCLSPGEVATPILMQRPVVPSDAEQARMLQPEDLGRTIAFVASMPPRVCMNEILISPTHNRGFMQQAASPD